MLQGAFYSASYILDENTNITKNNAIVTLVKSNCSHKIEVDMNFLISKYNTGLLYAVKNSMYISTPSYILDFEQKSKQVEDTVSAYLVAVQKGTENAIKNDVIRYITVCYPFIRLSNIDNCFVFTFFTEVCYYSNAKSFVITELYPDNSTPSETLPQIYENIENMLFGVRASLWKISDNIYSYWNVDTNINSNYDNDNLFCNYILRDFVHINFGLDIDKRTGTVGIVSQGSFSPNFNTKSNYKTIYLDSSSYFIGVLSNQRNYKQYAINAMKELFLFEIVRTIYSFLFELIDQKKDEQKIRDEQQLQFILDFLRSIQTSKNIDFPAEINLLIKKNHYNNLNNLWLFLSELAGRFLGSILNVSE